MKTIFSILVILVVVVLIGGGFYGAVNAASSGADQASVEERPTDGEFSPPDHEDDDGGVQFPVEMIKSLVIMSVAAVAYLNIPKYFGRKKTAMPTGS